MTERNPAIFIIGAGPVATALAGGFRAAGLPTLGIWARRPEQARASGSAAGVAFFSSAPPSLILEADVIICAVRDDAISDVASLLVGTGLIAKKHVLIHCSGAVSASEVFQRVTDDIGGMGTMHPLRAIADGKAAMTTFKNTFFGVEGDERGRQRVQQLVLALGGKALELESHQMAAYHAAAAIASNYSVALMDVAATILEESGVSEEDAERNALKRGFH